MENNPLSRTNLDYVFLFLDRTKERGQMTELDKEQAMQVCRKKIIENALQIARLKMMGCFIDKDGIVNMIGLNDIDHYSRGFEIELASESKLLLQLSTIGIEQELNEP